jgi:hypothetical protein
LSLCAIPYRPGAEQGPNYISRILFGAERATIDTSASPTDDQFEQRIRSIYSELDTLSAVTVTVRDGVDFLADWVSNEALAAHAIALEV